MPDTLRYDTTNTALHPALGTAVVIHVHRAQVCGLTWFEFTTQIGRASCVMDNQSTTTVLASVSAGFGGLRLVVRYPYFSQCHFNHPHDTKNNYTLVKWGRKWCLVAARDQVSTEAMTRQDA